MSLKVCVAGKGRIAINALNTVLDCLPPDGEVYAIFNANEDGYDAWQPSFKRFVESQPSIKVATLEDVMQIADVIFLSMEYDRIIKPDRFQGAPCLVNMHFSLLPAYKGMFTSAIPILLGEAASGCTLHLIDAGVDTGAIIAQTRFELSEHETCKSLYAKYVAHGSALFSAHARAILRRGFNAVPQGIEGSTYYSKKYLDYENLNVDWNSTAQQVARQIRAFNHRSYQLPAYENLSIAGVSILPSRSLLKPGRLVERDANALIVATIDFDVMLAIDEFDALISASRAGDVLALRHIVARNPLLLHESGKEGWTALMAAAFAGADGGVAALLELGADPNLPNQKGTTPLMYAKEAYLRDGNAAASLILLRAGARLDTQDMWGRTLLDYLSDNQKLDYHAGIISRI